MQQQVSFDELPDEVIEFILSLVPMYRDLHECMLVCKRWRRSVHKVVQMKRRDLHRSIRELNVRWQRQTAATAAIAKRYSHAAVMLDNSMYVFGGCTNSMTTFNDIWRLDLSRRQWVRPSSTGSYPTPKACSCMVAYRHLLVLFGGWAYPSQYPFHQSYQLFNELHVYDTKLERWDQVVSSSGCSPPPMAGHTVSVHGKYMVVFGGMQRSPNTATSVKTNQIWKLDLENFVWSEQETSALKPAERYGHSQMGIDAQHLAVTGGCGGPNTLYTDVWLLTMGVDAWHWTQIPVDNRQWAPPDAWCHPACRVNDSIVVLNRAAGSTRGRLLASVRGRASPPRRPQQPAAVAPVVPPPVAAPAAHNKVISHRLGTMSLSLSAFTADSAAAPPPPPSANRQRQLDLLRKMEQRIHSKMRPQQQPVPCRRTAALCLYVLDISGILREREPSVAWLQPSANAAHGPPDETLLYTLVLGNAELVMFGGIQKDNDSASPHLSGDFDPTTYPTKVSNSLHFITPPLNVI